MTCELYCCLLALPPFPRVALAVTQNSHGNFKMLVELVLRGPNDDDDFEVKFLKRFYKLGKGFVFPVREVCL